MSQKHFDSMYVQGSKNFAVLFSEPIFYSMMSPFYVETNKEITQLGLANIPNEAQRFLAAYDFALKKFKKIESLAEEYYQNSVVKSAMLPYFVSAYGTYEYSGNASTASKTELAIKDLTFKRFGALPTKLDFRLAMQYGFFNYAIEPVKEAFRQFLFDIPDGVPDQFDRFMENVAVPYAKYVQAAGVVAVFAAAAVVIGAAAAGTAAADGALGAAAAESAAAGAANVATGTTLAEVTVAVGAEGAAATAATSAAAATTSTTLSSVGTFVSAQTAAGVAAAGAALEAAAKKEVQNQIVGALTPSADAAPGAPGGAPAASGPSAIPKILEIENAKPIALGALGLLLLLFI